MSKGVPPFSFSEAFVKEPTVKDLAEAIGTKLGTARAYAIRSGKGTLKIINGVTTRVFTQEDYDDLVIDYLMTPPKPGPTPRKETQ